MDTTHLHRLAKSLDQAEMFHIAQEVYDIADNASENPNKKCAWCKKTFNLLKNPISEPFDQWLCENCIEEMEKHIKNLEK